MSRTVIDAAGDVGEQADSRPEQLHGRSSEMATLRAALEGALAGRGRLALVVGEAGIGKTSLVESIAAEARQRGALILSGHCYDLETASPYEPWIELLRSYRPAAPLPPLPAGLSNAELLETLSGKDALYEQVAGFLSDLSKHRPVILLFEDMHWSDQASLDLLRAVARRARSWPLLIAATLRDNEIAPHAPLYRALPPLVRESRPTRIDLLPLETEAIRLLVRERYGLPPADEGRLVAHLVRYAEGIPFYLEEVLRTLEHERLLRRGKQGWALANLTVAPVPPLVRHLIDERVVRLGESVQHLVQIAAVIGLAVPPDLWQAAAGIDDEAFADAVDAARQAQIIGETPDRAALQFSHALVREALYDGVPLLRRRAWHRRLGELLAQQPDPDPDSVAHHLLQAGDADAARWLIRAAQRAERCDAAWDAIARYEQAIPLLQQAASSGKLAWLHTDLAESYRYVNPARSAMHLDAAEVLAQECADPVLALAIRWLRVRLRGFLGQNVLDDLQQCVAALDVLSADERARLASMGRLNLPSRGLLAQWLAFIGGYREATTYAEAVMAEEPAEITAARHNEQGAALIALALAHASAGRSAEAKSEFVASREQFRAIDASFMTASTLKWELLEVEMAYATEDLEERHRLLDEYRRTMARLGSFAVFRGERPLLQVFWPAMLEGRWNDVREGALAYLRVPAWRVSALAALGELERRQGKFAAAWSRVRAAAPDGAESEPGSLYYVDALIVQRLAASLALDEGDRDLALTWLDTHDRWLAWSGRVLDRAAGSLLRARYHLALGERAEARRWAEQALAAASTPRQPLAILTAHRALGELAASEGALPEAETHLAAALALANACAAPYERALTLVEQIRMLAAQHRPEAAAPLQEEARAIFTRLGAEPALDRLDAAVALATAETPTPPPAGLTRREVEVLRLVAQGLSYADVGARLYISPRTVGRHLQSIYGRLGVDSRAEATAFAFNHGLV